MEPEDFRKYGHELIDWIADYWEHIDDLPIVPDVAPGDIRAALPERAPEEPEPFSEIISDLDEIVVPGLTQWQSPGWFAFFPGNTSLPAVLGEAVTAALGQQGMMWSTSPVATELENVVVDWFVDLLGLPDGWKTTGRGGGVIQPSASDSTHTALVVARERAAKRGPAIRMVAYTSEQAHSSVEKGANLAGFGRIALVPVDGSHAMRPEALRRMIVEDIEAGLIPAVVTSAVGTTGTAAVDPVRLIGELAREYEMWHHVDAAYAGSAMICPEFQEDQDGLELVDSYTFNPHKWLLVGVDCSMFYVADRAPLIDAMSIVPPYLRNEASESGEVIDYRDWHVALGRRFRALKVWFVLRSYGAEGIRAMIREHVRLANELAQRLEADDRFELVTPVSYALVCFRHVTGDEATDALAAVINQSGHSHLTASKLDDRSFIRVSIGQTQTEQRHVDRLWDLIDRAAAPAR